MHRPATPLLSVFLAPLLALSAVACSSDGEGPEAAATTPPAIALPPETLDPADFVVGVDHPYFPLPPGATWTYRVTGEAEETIVIEVLPDAKTVAGIPVVVVHDRVTDAEGNLVEDTYDWYAQDRDGNVWYLGEDTTAYDGGKSSTAGSWEAGVGGARAGIIMLADPTVGAAYQQEFLDGEAEDQAQVMETGASRTTEAGSWSDILVTNDFTPLEPGLLERKYYAPGVGVVYEESLAGENEQVELVSYSLG